MTGGETDEVEQLMRRAARGDDVARHALLDLERSRLGKMVAVRMDSRLSARFDPSDVVQDALLIASGKLDHYLRDRPLPFYPWLRQIAWERLAHLHEQHIVARKRSVRRETHFDPMLSDQSVMQLAGFLGAPDSSPSRQLASKTRREQVREALQQLKQADREVLVVRFLEELSVKETADVLGISEGAVQMRQLRALERLRDLLNSQWEESG